MSTLLIKILDTPLPHDLIMISIMYTTCSYHGDQPLGEYLSRVSLASYPCKHSDCRRNECLHDSSHLHMSFFQKSGKRCFGISSTWPCSGVATPGPPCMDRGPENYGSGPEYLHVKLTFEHVVSL